MKSLCCLLLITVLFSCSKNQSDGIDNPATQSGAISGTIKVFDRYGNENGNYNDITLKMINSQGQEVTGAVAGNGSYRFENVLLGDVTFVINKPGYGFVDSLTFRHQKPSDTLTNIPLIEELPFSCRLNSASYSNSFFTFSGSYTYQSTDNYMVSEYLCFSKEPGVSINHNNLLWSPSSQTNVQYITGISGSSSTLSLKTLTDAGFKMGDQIYVSVIPGIGKFWTSYYNENNNYTISHYKVGNASNVVSFTLR